MMIMRKVARAASAGFVNEGEFEKFWPGPQVVTESGATMPSWAATSIELRNELIKKFKEQDSEHTT